MILTRDKSILKNYSISLKEDVGIFTNQLFYSLFNALYQQENQQEIEQNFYLILKKLNIEKAQKLWTIYKNTFLEIRAKLDLDAISFEKNDPACKSLEEVYLAYPGFYAIAIHRLSNQLLAQQIPILPRMMSEFAHSTTGADIHPGAKIGNSFFIDHATGIVIGETTIIKDNVKIFQGVTLGGIQVKKSLSQTKRHPTIENNVTIYANATILGGDVILGENSTIGANVCITESIPENVIVTNQSNYKITKKSRR
jgi:serine O-acetyltransferase